MKHFPLQTDISNAEDQLGYVKAFKEIDDKENPKQYYPGLLEEVELRKRKANHGKAVVSAKRNCLKTMLFVSDVSVLQTRCVFKKMKTIAKSGFALTARISYVKVNGFI